MSIAKRTSVLVMVLVLLLALTLPLPAFAVDPVSASVIANSFAQAISAYGAANGVGITFNVSNGDGIGEGMHQLWQRFRSDQQTADDYATLAQTIFPDLYYKTAVALGTASDAVAVGIHISDTYAETFDEFYNWLLSGPAEMVQLDNSYYQFQQAQIGDNAQSLNVYTGTGIPTTPILISGLSAQQYFDASLPAMQCVRHYNNKSWTNTYGVFSYNEVFYVVSIPSSNGFAVIINQYNKSARYALRQYGNGADDYSNISLSATANVPNHSGWYYNLLSETDYPGTTFDNFNYYLPSYPSVEAAVDDIIADVPADSIGVKASDNSGIANIPDTTDPNYDALNRAKDIPIDQPWDDILYGDGTGTLTDAQSAAISADLTDAIEADTEIELVQEGTKPIYPEYNDVLLPLIPINIPSFNFSLSGIWHYVRSWVSSLAAWLSAMFSVWAILPYAIVVPVYACIVIVIVLGLYKRFFM